MSDINELSITQTAKSIIDNVSRSSFSDKGLDSETTSAIAEAITAAILEYDRQKNS